MRLVAAALALSGLLALSGCAALEPLLPQPARPSQQPSGPLYERYTGLGEIPVYGVSPDDPGPRIFIEIVRVPQLSAFLRQQGVPDSLEVEAGDAGGTHIVLTYVREGNPPSRRVVVESLDGQLSAYAPTRLDGGPLNDTSPRARRPASHPPGRVPPRPEEAETPTGTGAGPTPPVLEPPPANVPLATELQILECPIDPERPDCVELCAPGAPYEWCPLATGGG